MNVLCTPAKPRRYGSAPYRQQSTAAHWQVLAERECWAADTQAVLASGVRSVVRLSARMPASLRSRGLADRPVGWGVAAFEAECRRLGLSLQHLGPGRGTLGPWVLWTSDNEPFLLKQAALLVEEESVQGQLLDLDVHGQAGPVSRALLGLSPRPCVVCGQPAAVCTGRSIHSPSAVQAAFLDLLEHSSGFYFPGSPDGCAVGVEPPLNI
ncbi:MAG: citrate lyase holo-[acyl-carrier protein] synthase [Clostridia bacterium]|jgi:holo-ACP synthase CitX